MRFKAETLFWTVLCYFRVEAIQVIKVGHQISEGLPILPTAELFDSDTSTSCVLSTGYFDHTSNKYGDAGVTYGMMCDYVFEKGTLFENLSEFIVIR